LDMQERGKEEDRIMRGRKKDRGKRERERKT
jgi:hypothetical protein